jgi:hypothetical protein
MSKLHINIGSRGVPTTVSEMRIRLAKAISHLDGGAEVSFDFRVEIAEYRPARVFKIPDSPTTRHARAVISDLREEQPAAVYGELARPEND